MRLSGGFLLLSLIAVGFVLYLVKLDIDSSLNAVTVVASDLREEGVTGAVFEVDTARQMIFAMEGLVDDPAGITDHTEDLQTFSATAASWASIAPVASPELHAAVMLRRAAGALRSYAMAPSERHLVTANRCLAAATTTLNGQASSSAGGSASGPGLAVGAIRDQIENLEQAHQERIQEVDEELKEKD